MNWRARGLRPWVWQRLSAVYLALFLVYAAVTLAHLPAGFPAWRAWLASPLGNAAWSGAVLALVLHAWVGLRDVTLDYVRPAALRLGLIAAFTFALGGLALWVLRALFTLEAA